MLLPRLHLFELEDFATDYLHFIEKRYALHKPMVPLVRDALKQSGAEGVVDLCSGGGGPVLDCPVGLIASFTNRLYRGFGGCGKGTAAAHWNADDVQRVSSLFSGDGAFGTRLRS